MNWGERSPPWRTASNAVVRFLVGTLLSAAAAAAVACDASGDVRGGDPLFDAAPPAVTPPEEDAGPIVNPTWAGLYADYFGPTGKASCSGDGACHGDASHNGAKLSAFVCGADKDACFASITGESTLVRPGADPSSPSGLELILRKEAGGGRMPLRPASVTFSRNDIARIRAWIRNGAKNDG